MGECQGVVQKRSDGKVRKDRKDRQESQECEHCREVWRRVEVYSQNGALVAISN